VGNAIWGGVRLADVLERAGIAPEARHVAFEGLDNPVAAGTIKFIRSIPSEKAMDSTIMAYEIIGEPLPLEHGCPLRALGPGLDRGKLRKLAGQNLTAGTTGVRPFYV
jgi:DMSO/TMAO reductase YedYZ molybdopterin-dependent catalytic subunit